MRTLSLKKITLHVVSLPVLLLTLPACAAASEGPLWLYFMLAPFMLFEIPFFLTGVCTAVAAYFYWRYRTGNKALGTVAVIAFFLAIPLAIHDKAQYLAQKESRQALEANIKTRRNAAWTGKPLRTDFAALSTALAKNFKSTGNVEVDRQNYQAARDMVQFRRQIEEMQQKEGAQRPPAPAVEEKHTPERTPKTLLYELYSVTLLTVTGLAGYLIACWRVRRHRPPLIHLVPLIALIYIGVAVRFPFLMTNPEKNGGLYISFIFGLIFTPLSFFAAYLLGVLFFLWRARGKP